MVFISYCDLNAIPRIDRCMDFIEDPVASSTPATISNHGQVGIEDTDCEKTAFTSSDEL